MNSIVFPFKTVLEGHPQLSFDLEVPKEPEKEIEKVDTMNPIYLKIKAKSLAEEARIIRRIERKLKKRNRYLREKSRETDYLLNSVHEHRVEIIRPVARSTHLARGYIKGTPYKTIENKAYSYHLPNFKEIWKMVKSYGYGYGECLDPEKFRRWFAVDNDLHSEWRWHLNYCVDQELKKSIKSIKPIKKVKKRCNFLLKMIPQWLWIN